MAETGTYPEIAGLAEARSQCYALLSASFSVPTADLVSIWRDAENVASLFREKDLIPFECPGFKEIESFIQHWKGEVLPELLQTYVQLFFASPHFVAPPYESVYMEGGFVMGEAAAAVARVYSREGVGLSPAFKDLPDHIAAELEFMALLAQREAACWEKRVREVVEQITREETFLRKHLCVWLPHFSKRLEKSGEPFYSPLARITDSFAQVDLLRLSALRESLSRLEDP